METVPHENEGIYENTGPTSCGTKTNTHEHQRKRRRAGVSQERKKERGEKKKKIVGGNFGPW